MPEQLIQSKLRPRFGDVVLDLTFTEQHGIENDITDHPIDTGDVETDHALTKPRRIVLDGLVSSQNTTLLDVARSLRPSNWKNEERHIAAWRRIVQMGTNHEVVTVTTTLETLPRMMIKSAIVNRRAEEGLFVTITLKQVSKAFISMLQIAPDFEDIARPPGFFGSVGTSVIQGGTLGPLQFVGIG